MDLVLATPAIWYPGQDEAEWQVELEAMLDRALVTSEFLKGNVPADVFLDCIAEEYGDPLKAAELWEAELEQCLILP